MTARAGWGLIFGFSIGAVVAVQGRINGALGGRLHDGIAAATISFGTGFVVLAVVFAASKRLRAGWRQVRASITSTEPGTLRPWQLLGGLCGAFLVACQGLTVATIGVAAFTVAVVAGQLVSSLVVDRLGVGPGGRSRVTPRRLGGAGLGVVAVLVAGLGGVGGAGDALGLPTALHGVPTALLIALPALAGIGAAWQQAVNGRVGVVGGPMSATLVNFGVGLLALVVFESMLLVGTGLPTEFPTAPWLYAGGVVGVAGVALAAVAVRRIGVLLLGLTAVAGQLIVSVVLDVVTPTGAGLSTAAVVGCALTLIAVAVATKATE